jgi:hypothetical protein
MTGTVNLVNAYFPPEGLKIRILRYFLNLVFIPINFTNVSFEHQSEKSNKIKQQA